MRSPTCKWILTAGPDLVIQCWETGGSGIRPRLPWLDEDFARLADPGALGPHLHFADLRYRMASTAQDDLVIYDRENRHAAYWVERQSEDSDRSQAATLREVLNWHLAERGTALMHTAAVGDERGMCCSPVPATRASPPVRWCASTRRCVFAAMTTASSR